MGGGDGNTTSRLLSGSDVGIIGFGDLGKALRRMLAGFRCNIKVYDPWGATLYTVGSRGDTI